MGIGKSDPPPAPDYVGQAIATANSDKYNTAGPGGAATWSLRPGADPTNPQPGDYIQQTTLSPEQQQIYDLNSQNKLGAGQAATAAFQDVAGGSQGTQDAIYRRATQYYDQNFGDQESALRTQLLNSGLAEGSTAYDRSMRNFDQQRNTAYADATDRAIVGADASQNSATQRLIQLLAASGASPTPQTGQGGGADLSSATRDAYQAAVGNTNAGNAQAAQGVGTAASLGTLAYLLYAASDRRLKSDIVHIGAGYADLPVYDYTIEGHRERGYMADEVEAKFPEAVATRADGYKMVAYGMLGGRP